MPVMTVCTSHAPLAGDEERKGTRFQAAIDRVAEKVKAFKPDVVVQFAPDHYNGFFYDLMPNFCVGVAAESVGDWGTEAGPLNVPSDLALRLVNAVRDAEIDIDISYRMQVDHGFTQPLEMLFGSLDPYPVVPIMINCVATPAPTFKRTRLLGEAVGRFLSGLPERVLILGSGGLSHDPPIPRIDSAEGPAREALIAGRNPPAEARAAREKRVVDVARKFIEGNSPCREPNAEWDNNLIELLAAHRIAAADNWAERWVTEEGGCGAHEVRTWVAAFAAQGAARPYRANVEYYEVVREWITGMGVMSAVEA